MSTKHYWYGPRKECSMSTKHYWYGSGLPGCLFDNGPNYAGTDIEDAIEAALLIFCCGESDLSGAEVEEAKADLRECGTHYFPNHRRSALGAGMVQVWGGEEPNEENEDI